MMMMVMMMMMKMVMMMMMMVKTMWQRITAFAIDNSCFVFPVFPLLVINRFKFPGQAVIAVSYHLKRFSLFSCYLKSLDVRV